MRPKPQRSVDRPPRVADVGRASIPAALVRVAAVCGLAVGFAVGLAGPAAALAPDRGYELVSPPDKAGANTAATAVSPDGTRVLTVGGGGYVGTPSQDGIENNYLALRGSAGWLNRPLNMPATVFATPGKRQDSSADLALHLLQGATYEESAVAGTGFYLRDADGGLRRASPPIYNLTRPDDPAVFTTFVGASADFDHIVFTTASDRPVLPTDAVEGSLQNVYEVYDARGDEPKVRRVDVDGSGAVVGLTCGRRAGGERSLVNLISEDGQTVFFSGRTPTTPGSCLPASRGPVRVFARLGGASTVEISASECDRVADPVAIPPVTACTVAAGNAPAAADAQFRGASSDGSVALLSTNQQLADSDTDATDDLYEYRRNPGPGEGHLTQVTAATGQSATPGNGARHLGVLRISDDGKRVYFVAQGVLTTDPGANGTTATNSTNNLYVFERTEAAPAGRIRFVATLGASGDTAVWGNDSASKQVQLGDAAGRFLVFRSTGRLTPDDTDSVGDLYRYDAVDHSLVRVSRGKDGYGTDGNGAIAASIRSSFGAAQRRAQAARAITEDGSGIVFTTNEALQGDDLNAAIDVYEWDDGSVELVTDGRSTLFAPLSHSITPDGESILFTTASRLTADDIDGALDAYVARRGGGFVIDPPQPPDVCVGDACQGPADKGPGSLLPMTSGFAGAGNVLDPREAAPRLSVSSASRVRARHVTLTVRPSTKGIVRVSGSGLRSQRKSLTSAGAQKLKVRLSAGAARKLAERGRLSVVIRVRFQAASGRVVTKSKRVLFLPSNGRADGGNR